MGIPLLKPDITAQLSYLATVGLATGKAVGMVENDRQRRTNRTLMLRYGSSVEAEYSKAQVYPHRSAHSSSNTGSASPAT
jgi:4-hydroxybenzoate polyprenyltransferase